jgi:hypothetical protein
VDHTDFDFCGLVFGLEGKIMNAPSSYFFMSPTADIGPSSTPGIVGNTSPSKDGTRQLVNSSNPQKAKNGISIPLSMSMGDGFSNYVLDRLPFFGQFFKAIPSVNTAIDGIGIGSAKVGEGVGKAVVESAASATEGIKKGFSIGVFVLVLLGGIVLFAQVRRATG